MAKLSRKKKVHPVVELLPTRRVSRLDVRFLQALLLEGRSVGFIQRTLENNDLPPTSEEELTSVRATLHPPKKFKPRSVKHKASVVFIETTGFSPYFRGAMEWDWAQRILESARLREIIEAGLIVRTPVGEILKLLASHLQLEVPAKALLFFAFLFFDARNLARSQLRVRVQERVRIAVMHALASEADTSVAARGIEADARNIAVTMPTGALSWAYVLLSLGIKPPTIKLGEMLDEVADVAAIRAASMVLRGDEGDAEVAERFTSVLVKTKQVRETIRLPEDALNKGFHQLRLVHNTSPVVTAAQLLAEGDGITADVGPPVRTLFDCDGGSEAKLEDDVALESGLSSFAPSAADI